MLAAFAGLLFFGWIVATQFSFNDNQVSIDELRSGIDKILEQDTELGTIRNNQPYQIPLHQAVKNYCNSLRQLDYSKTPEVFSLAFIKHVEAWEAAIPEFEKFSELRGELHEIFEKIKPQSEDFLKLESAIWSSWADIESVVKFYRSSLAEKPFVFTSNKQGNNEIYMATLNGSKWHNLTNHSSSDNWPVVSSDKKQLLFQSRRNGNLDVYLLSLDNKMPYRLTSHEEQDYLASFSSDNKSVYFTSWRSVDEKVRQPHFFRMGLMGEEQQQWTQLEPNNSTGVEWQPSGYFGATTIHKDEEYQIYLIDTEGNIVEKLTNLPGYNSGARFSPDGKQIAFYSNTRNYSHIGLIDLTTQERKITWLISDGFNWQPVWSADGKWLTFTRAIDEQQNNLDIFVIEIDNPNMQIPIIESPARDSEFNWL